MLNQFQLENQTINLLCEPFLLIDQATKVKSITIERAGQKPIDKTIPTNRQDQKQIVETISIGISKHKPIL